MEIRILRSAIALALVLVCGCQDIVPSGPGPTVADLTGEWDFAIQLPGDEGGFCSSYGTLLLDQVDTVLLGTATRYGGTCSMPPLDSVTSGAISETTVRFTAGGCAFEGALDTLGADSIAGVLACSWTAGTWSAARVGSPSVLNIDPGDRTLSVGGTQTYRATLFDEGGNVLYGRIVTWTSSAPSAVGVEIVDSAFQTEVSVIGAAPGTSQVHAVAGGMGASVTITVAAVGFVRVAAGDQHSCGLTASGAAWCWGSNASGRLGTGDTIDVQEPVPVAGGHAFTTIAGGRAHTCALDTTGAAWCWGYGGGGWLGDGTLNDHHTPAPVAGGQVFTSLVVGDYHACALTAAGAAWCWGGNDGGQIGDSSRFQHSLPVPVAGGHAFVELAAGQSLTCGRTAAGAAWCWGANGHGEQGTGSPDSAGTPYPSPVSGGLAFTALAVGRLHACGVAGGAAYCWGGGVYGQTGLGSRNTVRVPTPVTGGHAFTAIAATSDHTCALEIGGAIWCWGSNGIGQLGVAAPTETDVPVAVTGGHLFGSVAAGGVHTCGLDDGGIAWCWGFNFLGQLGDGTRTDRRQPVRVVGQ